MPDLASITLPNNVTYNFKDETARNLIPTYFRVVYDVDNHEVLEAPTYTDINNAFLVKPLIGIKAYYGYYNDNDELIVEPYVGESLLDFYEYEEEGVTFRTYSASIWYVTNECEFVAVWYSNGDGYAEIGINYPFDNVNNALSNLYQNMPQPSTSSDIPIMDGTAARGSSLRYARADHVHPSDTSRAAKTTVPTQASISSAGLITFKNSSNSSLFTLQLPLYNGGMS